MVNVGKHSIHAIGYIIYLIFVAEKNIQTKVLFIFVCIISKKRKTKNIKNTPSKQNPSHPILVLPHNRAIILSTQTMHCCQQITQNYHTFDLVDSPNTVDGSEFLRSPVDTSHMVCRISELSTNMDNIQTGQIIYFTNPRFLVGSFNPFEKSMSQNGFIFPK